MWIEFLGFITIAEVEYLAAVARCDICFSIETARNRRKNQTAEYDRGITMLEDIFYSCHWEKTNKTYTPVISSSYYTEK